MVWLAPARVALVKAAGVPPPEEPPVTAPPASPLSRRGACAAGHRRGEGPGLAAWGGVGSRSDRRGAARLVHCLRQRPAAGREVTVAAVGGGDGMIRDGQAGGREAGGGGAGA